jgi:hypothetical protein
MVIARLSSLFFRNFIKFFSKTLGKKIKRSGPNFFSNFYITSRVTHQKFTKLYLTHNASINIKIAILWWPSMEDEFYISWPSSLNTNIKHNAHSSFILCATKHTLLVLRLWQKALCLFFACSFIVKTYLPHTSRIVTKNYELVLS